MRGLLHLALLLCGCAKRCRYSGPHCSSLPFPYCSNCSLSLTHVAIHINVAMHAGTADRGRTLLAAGTEYTCNTCGEELSAKSANARIKHGTQRRGYNVTLTRNSW